MVLKNPEFRDTLRMSPTEKPLKMVADSSEDACNPNLKVGENERRAWFRMVSVIIVACFTVARDVEISSVRYCTMEVVDESSH